MAVRNGTSQDDFIDMTNLIPGQYETGNRSNAGSGNDTVYGSSYNDIIEGGDGNDLIYGWYGDDALIGDNGNDTLYGDYGNDLLYGGAGGDTLVGGGGNDNLFGGTGNDIYLHGLNDGVDIINDDLSAAANPGFGGGDDVLILTGISSTDILLLAFGNDLVITSNTDVSDGAINDAVIIQDFFLGGSNVIETVGTADGQYYDLTVFV